MGTGEKKIAMLRGGSSAAARAFRNGINNCSYSRLSRYSLPSYSTVAGAGASHEKASSEVDSGELELQTEVSPHLRTGLDGEALLAFLAIELALDSVVKMFTVTSSPNYHLPWQNKSQRETMDSGFVISGKRILTNAPVVANLTVPFREQITFDNLVSMKKPNESSALKVLRNGEEHGFNVVLTPIFNNQNGIAVIDLSEKEKLPNRKGKEKSQDE
ncbi:OLC1v1025601C1 [Oldenlandia corymbosa var. corymbosa]|uniref:OLC1v1025601C1 n=1 Tax=Oldenlandia corymbosa var. corymbosa TaxID=529605 RepID=A0AAV1C5J4_OLDCO|nr:OLC1v1025601C1 [Oldenlandia corymbosa var. corymbosa]